MDPAAIVVRAAVAADSDALWPLTQAFATSFGPTRVPGTEFGPVSVVRPGQLTPHFARAETASMLARDQSSPSASENSSSTS